MNSTIFGRSPLTSICPACRTFFKGSQDVLSTLPRLTLETVTGRSFSQLPLRVSSPYLLDQTRSLPFRWKWSPVMAQAAVGEILRPIHHLLSNFQYFDNVLLGDEDPHWVTLITVHLLTSAGLVISPKSSPTPTTSLYLARTRTFLATYPHSNLLIGDAPLLTTVSSLRPTAPSAMGYYPRQAGSALPVAGLPTSSLRRRTPRPCGFLAAQHVIGADSVDSFCHLSLSFYRRLRWTLPLRPAPAASGWPWSWARRRQLPPSPHRGTPRSTRRSCTRCSTASDNWL